MDELIGTTLDGKIELLSLLGSGASGVVYKAHHSSLDTMVAVKVLNSAKENEPSAKQRFVNEALLLSRLRNEHIVNFYAYGILPDGRNYMVLEFLEGKTLQKLLLENQVIPHSQALNIFKQICSGLAYAHANDVIHRDIKPANIMVCDVSNSPQAKILDFGIFKAINSDNQNLTKTGVALGSVNYMSPEQCKNEDLDARCDLYSFGCLMYECLVGQPPMQDASDFLILSNHVNKQITNIPAKNGISKQLSNLILKCLEKDKSKRFKDASDLLEALNGCLDAEGKPAVNSSHFRSNSAALWMAALLLCSIISSYFYASHNKGENKTEDTISLDFVERKRPAAITTLETLYEAENWLKKRLKRRLQAFDLTTAAVVYGDCFAYRLHHHLPQVPGLWETIEPPLSADNLEGSSEWMLRHRQLALLYVMRAEKDKAKEEIEKGLSRA